MEEKREETGSRFLTVGETARRLNVSPATIYRRVHEGQIPAIRVGQDIGPIRIDRDELEAWLYGSRSAA